MINFIDQFQRTNKIPKNSQEYRIELEKDLTEHGLIGKRKPSAVTTNAKASYIRDEFKLWNKLGLLVRVNNSRYFFPEQGLKFDWQRITDVLTDIQL